MGPGVSGRLARLRRAAICSEPCGNREPGLAIGGAGWLAWKSRAEEEPMEARFTADQHTMAKPSPARKDRIQRSGLRINALMARRIKHDVDILFRPRTIQFQRLEAPQM